MKGVRCVFFTFDWVFENVAPPLIWMCTYCKEICIETFFITTLISSAMANDSCTHALRSSVHRASSRRHLSSSRSHRCSSRSQRASSLSQSASTPRLSLLSAFVLQIPSCWVFFSFCCWLPCHHILTSLLGSWRQEERTDCCAPSRKYPSSFSWRKCPQKFFFALLPPQTLTLFAKQLSLFPLLSSLWYRYELQCKARTGDAIEAQACSRGFRGTFTSRVRGLLVAVCVIAASSPPWQHDQLPKGRKGSDSRTPQESHRILVWGWILLHSASRRVRTLFLEEIWSATRWENSFTKTSGL